MAHRGHRRDEPRTGTTGPTNHLRRGAAFGLVGVVCLAVLAGCGGGASTTTTGQQAAQTTPKGTRVGGALGAAAGEIPAEDVEESTTTSEATTTTTAAPSTTTPPPSVVTTVVTVTTQPPQQQPQQQQVPQQQVPQQQQQPAPTINVTSTIPNCGGGGNVPITISWTGTNLSSVTIFDGGNQIATGPGSGSQQVQFSCPGTRTYYVRGSNSGGSAEGHVTVNGS